MNDQPIKRRTRKPSKTPAFVIHAVRIPTELREYFRGFENPSAAIREALEEYRANNGGHNDAA